VSGKVIAMSEKTENPTKTEQINTEKTTEKNVPIVKRLASVMLNYLKDSTDIVNEYKDTLNQYKDNPFTFYAESDIINFKIELENPIKLPRYYSLMVFGAELSVNTIEIKGHNIIFYFSEKSEIDKYIIGLDNEKLPIMDLILLVYVFQNMSYNDHGKYSLNLKDYDESIRQEKTMIMEILRNNGIETEKIENE